MVERGRTYRLEDFKRLAGMGKEAFRNAVAAGLRVTQVGRNGYVSGDDWHAFVAARPAVGGPQAAPHG